MLLYARKCFVIDAARMDNTTFPISKHEKPFGISTYFPLVHHADNACFKMPCLMWRQNRRLTQYDVFSSPSRSYGHGKKNRKILFCQRWAGRYLERGVVNKRIKAYCTVISFKSLLHSHPHNQVAVKVIRSAWSRSDQHEQLNMVGHAAYPIGQLTQSPETVTRSEGVE